jgi:hypothetical protein
VTEYSLFNSADDCLAYSLLETTFDESLILNVLFQERLLLHEAYFFNSTLLASHVERAKMGTPSLFELAARRGLIVPAFRDPKTQTIDQAQDVMKATYGSSYGLIHPRMQPFRDRVLAAVNMGLETTKPFYWPSGGEALGVGYHKTIRELLQTEHPPEYSSFNRERELLIQRVWEASKAWRFDYVEEAAERTKSKGALGLQRLELFCSLGWSLGIPRDVVTLSPEDIIARCSDKEQELAMRVFLKWVTQCYHLNQARHFGTAINFPVYNIDQDFIIDTLMRSPLDLPPESSEGFRCEVDFPPLDALVKADTTELVAIRADLGGGYLFALRRWQREPSVENQEAVKASLRDYCNQICARYNFGIRQALVADISKGRSSPWADVVSAAVGIGQIATGTPIGLFSQLTKTITKVYKYYRVKKLSARLRPKQQDVEVTLPSSNQPSSLRRLSLDGGPGECPEHCNPGFRSARMMPFLLPGYRRFVGAFVC